MITFGLLFWIIWIIWIIFGGWTNRGAEGGYNWSGFGGWFIFWILVGLLGYKVFGPPLAGG